MFDFVAKHKRILQVVIALTVIPFAFFGLEAYTRSVGAADNVASVEGVAITQREFADELRRQQDRLRELFGRGADVTELDTPEMRLAILESLIAQRLVVAEVVNARLALAKEDVVAGIIAAPEFQDNGKFSTERYAAYLRTRGLSDEGNVSLLRLEIPAARLTSVISATAFQPRAVAERLSALEGQKREIAEALVAAEQFLPRVKLDEARIKPYYDANPAEFRVPERVRAEYLVLSAEELGKSEPVSDLELKAAYEARASQYGAAEQRRASHILLKARDAAEKLISELKKSPGRFAELAKKHSLDAGSAGKGGDLGLNAKGSLASRKLEDAIFKLKPNEISDVVETEFGFHILWLTWIEAAKARPLDEVRQELAADIARQKGAKKFAEAAEGVNNLVYEQSDSLKPAAERYQLKLATTGWFTRQPSPELGVLAHPKLIAALFAADAIQQRRNTDAIEVSPGVVVAARVAEHQPATQRPFEEVKPDVERRLARREAAALAQKEGAEKLAALAKDGDAGLRWSAAKAVSRRDPQGLAPAALRRIMAADAAKLPAYVGIERGDQGYAIYRVSRVIAAEARTEQQNAEELARIDRQAGAEQLDAYVASLRARAKVEINRANLEKK